MKYVMAFVAIAAAVATQPALAQDTTFDGPSVTAIVGLDVNTKRLPGNSSGVLYSGQSDTT